ncbi:DUF2390 domain-containing protein [Thioalkalivibrio sp. ALJ1]|uniref:DUF2390 domain-containing protein n=1 Tax=Thioalkalivibrio sp. ALJ1 TaxID=1158144 RepID=UPI0003768B34|nr:DUF2390 domain-containing protein [Thioalkalivibrio sp. ALJ1]
MPDTDSPAGDFARFWQYANRVWNHPAARDRLLHWQDTFGVDVMLLLYALWFPALLAPGHWHQLQAEARTWQDSRTQRIRALRRRLRTPERTSLYRAVLDLELRCEHLEGQLLHARARRIPHITAFPIDHRERLDRLFPEVPKDERKALLGTLQAAANNFGPGTTDRTP